MRKILCAIALAMSFVGGPRLGKAAVAYDANLVQDTVVSVDSTYDLNTNSAGIDRLSFVATYSTVTMTATGNYTFTSGRPSTATITVNDYTALIPRKATATIEMQTASTTTLRGQSVTLSGIRFQAGPGGDWLPTGTASGNATALAAAIDANPNFDAVAISTVVYTTATIAGTFANNWAITTNSTTSYRINGGTISGVNFQGGANRARLAIQGITFDIQNSTAVTSNTVTAKNISDSIMANATLAALFTSTWSAAVVTATSTLPGVNAYTLFTSTPGALRLNGSATATTGTFLNGVVTNVSTANDQITIANNRLKTGEGVWLSTGGVTPPTGLAQGTTYYVSRIDGSTLKLSSSKANAVAGTGVDMTGQGSPGTFTLNLIGLTGVPSFKWQVSNDGTNFLDLAVSSVTFTAAGSSAWDFGNVNYKYYRLNYTAPTYGGIDLTARGTGKR